MEAVERVELHDHLSRDADSFMVDVLASVPWDELVTFGKVDVVYRKRNTSPI